MTRACTFLPPGIGITALLRVPVMSVLNTLTSGGNIAIKLDCYLCCTRSQLAHCDAVRQFQDLPDLLSKHFDLIGVVTSCARMISRLSRVKKYSWFQGFG